MLLSVFLFPFVPLVLTLNCRFQRIHYFNPAFPRSNVQYTVDVCPLTPTEYLISYYDLQPFNGHVEVFIPPDILILTALSSVSGVGSLYEEIYDSYENLLLIHTAYPDPQEGLIAFNTSYQNCDLVKNDTCKVYRCPENTFICTCCQNTFNCSIPEDYTTTTVVGTSTRATTGSIAPTDSHPNVTFPDAKVGLKNLTEIPMTHNTVHHIMNQSLVYSRLGNSVFG